MPLITREVYASMGLNDGEYDLILKLLGREPSPTELGMFAVMWSEHCGYKYSRPILAKFKKYKEALDGGGLENAGIVDIGDGLGVTFKVESHNHPSAVEPYQGAATGVGGIIRDILTMGARPVACLNSLRFGPLFDGSEEVASRNRYLFGHVVSGIAGYGNCVGVPTVGGEVGFHPKYSGNPLVNAMCVGILRLDQVTTSAASGDGNPVVYLGSSTGKDGIHGATFASEELGAESDSKRPNVQIGDPFAEKLLIEATLEALDTGAVVAIQDMGAAGLTCSTVEMASKGRIGMEIDLDRVPMREQNMTAYELMLSESQERMLAVVRRGREGEVLEIFHRWGLPAVVIGSVKNGGNLVIQRHGVVEADLDPSLLTDHCPTYSVRPQPLTSPELDLSRIPEIEPAEALLTLLNTPEIASKRWVYRQYDQQVQTQTVVLPGQGDAAVIAPRGTRKGIAMSLDGNSRVVSLDPYVGGLLVVAEAARNVACTGALPKAVTDGLNYGSPENGEVYWQFAESVRGIADAAEALGTPVVSGNVSFYNRSDLGEIPPTPLIGMVGILDDAADALPSFPTAALEGLELSLLDVPLLDRRDAGFGASAYLAHVHGMEAGKPVAPNLDGERKLHSLLARLAKEKSIVAAHDTSEGGLAVALAEIAIGANRGIEAELPCEVGQRTDSALFGEFPGRVVICHPKKNRDIVSLAADEGGIACRGLGVFIDELSLSIVRGERPVVFVPVAAASEVFCSAIERGMENVPD